MGSRVVRLAVVFYTVMAVIGLAWIALAGESLRVSWPRPNARLEVAAFAGGLAFHLAMLFGAPRVSVRFAEMVEAIREELGGLRKRDVAFLAVLSGLGEEILFRGAVQASLGLVIATVLFALAHVPPDRRFALWPVYALFMGFFLGGLRAVGGDIWSAVILHGAVNAISLLYVGRRKPRSEPEERILPQGE